MGTKHFTFTFVAEPDVVSRWPLSRDMNEFSTEAEASMMTTSLRDWLMSKISTFCSLLELSSLNWLATEHDAKLQTVEQQDSVGNWWFVWVLNDDDIQASLKDLNQILHLANTKPHLFGTSPDEVRAAFDLDSQKDDKDFEVPDHSGEGEDPTYVICSLLALRRLLQLAFEKSMQIVHFRYSFRPR